MNTRFSGQTILVAGGTGGLGRSVSLAFLEEGAQVIVTYYLAHEFDALKGAIQGSGARLEGHQLNVSDETAVRQFSEKVLSRHPRVDALVNAVGGYAGGAKLWEQETNVFEHMLALNLRSGYALSRAFLPAMLKQARGAIVNVAAKAGLQPPAGAAAYAASKAAALALMESLAAEVKGSGVRINSILPSIIDTQPNRKAMPDADFAKWPKPQDIARVILFLCSDEAKVIHGAAIPVYGES
jgi:NAD(P)-dependent dehydrogenase (short-subunit alcohol dehydrogenase family)